MVGRHRDYIVQNRRATSADEPMPLPPDKSPMAPSTLVALCCQRYTGSGDRRMRWMAQRSIDGTLVREFSCYVCGFSVDYSLVTSFLEMNYMKPYQRCARHGVERGYVVNQATGEVSLGCLVRLNVYSEAGVDDSCQLIPAELRPEPLDVGMNDIPAELP